MEHEIHFNVKEIAKIVIYKESNTSYKWLPDRPGIKSFWPWRRKDSKISAFYYYGDYDQTCIGLYDFDSSRYLIRHFIDGHKLYFKPYIRIYFNHIEDIHKTFDTFEEALEFVKNIKSLSGNMFEIINY